VLGKLFLTQTPGNPMGLLYISESQELTGGNVWPPAIWAMGKLKLNSNDARGHIGEE
jgi:hypothetical protein